MTFTANATIPSATSTRPAIINFRINPSSSDYLQYISAKRQVHDRHGVRKGFQAPCLVARQPFDLRRVVQRLALAGTPFERDAYQREMRHDLAGLVLADRLDDGQDVRRFGDDRGFLEQLAPRAFEHGFAEFLRAAGKAPFADAGRQRALRQKRAPAAADDGETADDRPLGIEAVGLNAR